jgi:hypothetical protein
MHLWRIDEDRPTAVVASGIGQEERLESIIAHDVEILGLDTLMLLGRQVITDHGSRIDLLALDVDGTIYVIELKRSRTPRDVVAQALDYGSWVRRLSAERLAHIFETSPFARGRTFNAAFAEHFDVPLPEIINESQRLVIVASELDSSTQRIVEYLLDDYGVPVNVVFFHYFRDGGVEYLGRSWLRDPAIAEERTRASETKRTPGEWNGEDYYVKYGNEDRRSWDDAREYGYVSAGGGARWSSPLFRLQPDRARVFVHVPHHGYVAVGRVRAEAVPIGEFTVTVAGQKRSLLDVPLNNEAVKEHANDRDRAEYVVRVEWERAVTTDQAYWERGLFSRRGTTAIELRDPETSRKICAHFGIETSERTVMPISAGSISGRLPQDT